VIVARRVTKSTSQYAELAPLELCCHPSAAKILYDFVSRAGTALANRLQRGGVANRLGIYLIFMAPVNSNLEHHCCVEILFETGSVNANPELHPSVAGPTVAA
jgi:hypothetical protein